MSHLSTYDKVFVDSLNLGFDQLGKQLQYQSVPNWDSVGHMQLIAGIEEAFDIMLDTDDIIDFSSYEVGKQILSKYDIVI